ncbi:DUF916 and DUF3324 domain-containing protein [Fundicoccus sp. Sow4_D5]|uniref:DUF916 and DUF3324 domain-containing protein n=1 Tax=unclassified Fundicoccus TaxID=2761543 RepID=UPI003F90BC30
MKRILLIVLSTLFLTLYTTDMAEISASSYSIQTILPENQVSEASYFDIEIETGQEQILEVRVFNEGDEDIVVLVEANPGVTNPNGLVVYDGSVEAISSNDPIKFDSVVEVLDQEVTVPANGEAIARIKVTAPETPFDGRILGGLHFSLAPDETEEEGGVHHVFAYVTGLNIVNKGNDTKVTPEISLEKAESMIYYSRPSLMLTFENHTPTFITQVELTANIYGKDDLENPVLTHDLSNIGIAPNYQFQLPVSFEEETLKVGDYVVKVTLENEYYNWEFEEDFTITDLE